MNYVDFPFLHSVAMLRLPCDEISSMNFVCSILGGNQKHPIVFEGSRLGTTIFYCYYDRYELKVEDTVKANKNSFLRERWLNKQPF